MSVFEKHKTNQEIINEIIKNINYQNNEELDCISLYEISNLIEEEKNKINTLVKNYELQIENILQKENGPTHIFIIDPNYKRDHIEIKICFRKENFFSYMLETCDDFSEIKFTKKDNALFIIDSKINDNYNIPPLLKDMLLKFYDDCEKFIDFYEEGNFDIASINSEFLVDITKNGLTIFAKGYLPIFGSVCTDFKLRAYDNIFYYTYASNEVKKFCQGQEDKLLKGMFVKISDCPKWMQPILCELRQNELYKKQLADSENTYRKVKVPRLVKKRK